jgi:hypothetical protein
MAAIVRQAVRFEEIKILEGDREKVALIRGDISTLGVEDLGEEFNHVFEAFSLLGNSSEENVLFNVGHFEVDKLIIEQKND